MVQYFIYERGTGMNWNLLAVYVARALALITAIPVHEAAHAWASDRLGDPTARLAGRMSLNPLRHFDFLGALCMLIVGFGWAKPVPVAAVSHFRHPRRDMALSAAAGPLSNLLLAYLCMVLYKLVLYLAPATQAWIFVMLVLNAMLNVNITLAVFNLLPVPPLDGSRIFNVFLPHKFYFGIMRYERYIMIALFACLYFGLLDRPLSWLMNGAWNLLVYATSYIDMIRWVVT